MSVQYGNDSFYETFQTTPKETEGRTFFDLAEGRWNVDSLKESLLALKDSDGYIEDFEFEQDFPLVGLRILSLSARRIKRPSAPDEISFLLTIDDLTDQRLLERKVQQHQQSLEMANKELEMFSYSVSHDLRAPLRHMVGFVNLLKKNMDEKVDEKSRRYLDIIEKSSQHMGQLIDDLLAFSRNSRVEMSKNEVDLNQLISWSREELSSEEEGRTVKWDIQELPRIYGDSSLLQLVILNLLSNALKYTSGREVAQIQIGSFKNPGEEEEIFFFKDNGAGFDMKYKEKLFGIFQRLHHEKDFKGTGIGLANVQRIIARHGGIIWAEGAVGEGATFFFSLPEQIKTQKEFT